MLKFNINGETRLLNDRDDLFFTIEREYSRDVADYLRDLAKAIDKPCNGECDYVYQAEEHYRTIIQDAHDELTEVLNAPRLNRNRLQNIASELYSQM